MDFKDFSGSLVEGFKAALNNVSLGNLKNVVTNSSADNIKTPIESIKEYAEYLNAGALNHFWGFVKQIYRNNPIQAPILVLQVLTGACPSLVTAPFYTLLGFGRLGPLLGKHIRQTSLLPRFADHHRRIHFCLLAVYLWC